MKVSIIIRTKNEERWIASCLDAVFRQKYKKYEVIVVDNCSTDATIEIVKRYDVKLISIGEYLPGKAINKGIRASNGDVIVCLSGHCIPTNEFWLETLVEDFANPNVAGVYGRQEPLPYSSNRDKRDLITIFGLDRKIQRKDSFFHNANSAVRRSVWQGEPFDEVTPNIEDRLWARSVLEQNYVIVYEPDASVYHWHGIHQDGDRDRCRKVVNILESLELFTDNETSSLASNLNICAIIPVKGSSISVGDKSLIQYTIESALGASLINDVFISTGSSETAALARDLGALAPFVRPPELSFDYVTIDEVIKYSLAQIEQQGVFPDIVVVLEEVYPFRQKGLIDALIQEMLYQGVDTLIPVYPEYRPSYMKLDDKVETFDQGELPRRYKDPMYVNIAGLGMVLASHVIKNGMFTGRNVGIFSIDNTLSRVKVASEHDASYFADMLEDFVRSDKDFFHLDQRRKSINQHKTTSLYATD